MSTLSTTLVLPLNSIGTAIGIPNLGTWVNTFVNTIDQAEVNQEVLADLQQIQSSLSNLGVQISNISSQISSFENLLQESLVSSYTTSISSIFNDIQDIANVKIQTAADMADIKARMIDIGKTIVDDSKGVLNCVNQIDNILLSNPQRTPGFMNSENANLIVSNEFFSYYASIRSIALNYYGYYAQAQFCIGWAMALNANGLISFPEGADWLTQVQAKIANLQNFLDLNVPRGVFDLVTALTSPSSTSHSADIAISASTLPGWYLDFEPGPLLEGTLNTIVFGRFVAPTPVVGTLAPVDDIDTLNPNTQYRFSLSFSSQGSPKYMAPAVVNYYNYDEPATSNFYQLSGESQPAPSYRLWAKADGSFVFDFDDTVSGNGTFMNAGLAAADIGDTTLYADAVKPFGMSDPAQSMFLSLIPDSPPPWAPLVYSSQQIQIQSLDSRGYWTNVGAVPGAFSSGKNFAMSGLGNALYVVWRGLKDDAAVHIQSLDLSKDSWSGVGSVPGAFSSTGWIGATAFNDCLYVSWRGTEKDAAVYLRFLGTDGNWSALSTLPGAFTDTGPVLAVFDGALHCCWQGVNGDARIYHASMASNGTWSPVAPIAGASTTTGGIALSAFNGQLVAAWRGVGSDAAIYWSSYPTSSGGWSPASAIPGAFSDTGPALAVGNGAPMAFWKGIYGDRNIYQSSMGAYGTWTPLREIVRFSTVANCASASFGTTLYLGWIWWPLYG